ncbi:MAG: hypothetical protein AAF772_11255, partial [Acidobacteriota bacterium]
MPCDGWTLFRRAAAGALALTMLASALAADDAASSTAPALDAPSVAAFGRDATRLTLPRAGRYALRVESARGTALRLVDRLTGAQPWQGAPGATDGRVDLLLDAGVYRVETEGPAPPSTRADQPVDEAARVRVDAFVERHRAPLPTLPPARATTATLGDLEQRSWIVEQPIDGPFAVVAGGRHLAALRLWRDDGWLRPEAPRGIEHAPVVGQPQWQLHL